MPLGWFGLRERPRLYGRERLGQEREHFDWTKMERTILHGIGIMPLNHFAGAAPGIFQSKGKSAFG